MATDESPNPTDDQKPDLRKGAHEDLGVEIERDLSGGGHLARGDKTHFSNLRFRATGQARSERDPVFERPLENPGVAQPPASDPATASDPAKSKTAEAATDSPKLLQKVARIFGF